ncbi:MAG: LytTR family transcriptional regulator DNA-binding domain-containing protein [Rudanella sp.]|nr:LytTR family transcriptional regulator DNA-binding domain-containing protein [Rudanella sp.]
MNRSTPLFRDITSIPVEQILYLRGNLNYTLIYLTNGKRILSAYTLKLFDAYFADQPFVRIHRAYLVNPQHVVSYRSRICLSNGTQILPARRRESTVRREMKSWLARV